MVHDIVSFSSLSASLVALCGMDVLDRFPGRWVFFDRDFTELHGDWRGWQGMRAGLWCSRKIRR